MCEILKQPTTLLVTWFGSGLSKLVPGTMGTLATMPVAYFVHTGSGPFGLAIFGAFLFFIGCIASEQYLKAHPDKTDPGEIVIDESAGICFTLTIFAPNLSGYLAGFLLFRAFDIIKPWPVSWADKNVKGALGVMLDDGLAAAMIVGLIAAASWLAVTVPALEPMGHTLFAMINGHGF